MSQSPANNQKMIDKDKKMESFAGLEGKIKIR